jgi:hypothetical protein
MLESLRLGLEQNRQQQIDEGKITAEDVLQEGKNLLEDKQIDVNTVIPETLEEAENFTLTVDILEETIINNRSDIPKETINKILHSDSIGYYVMTKNLLRLKFMIEQGHDYYSLDHSLPLETTTFDSETSLLKIRNYPPFEVSKNKDDYNASHLILKYIFNHGSNNTHFYVDMYDSGLFSTHDDYNKEQHSEKYRNTCNYLNGKIQPE